MARSMCEQAVKPRRLKFIIAYDGTAYSGWQVQKGHTTVQGVSEATLAGIWEHPVTLHASGRTDQGVHARAQVAHADAVTRMDIGAIQRACNARLPRDIRVMRVQLATRDFHARFSAKAKEYRYFIWNDTLVPPDKRLYHAHALRPLDLAAMQAAAAHFVGQHDFAAFTANPQREVESTVREIFSCTLSRAGKRLTLRVKGNGFLYKQVRSIAGFLLRVGEGAEPVDAVAQLLANPEKRTARVPSAPPQGLFLWRVWYHTTGQKYFQKNEPF